MNLVEALDIFGYTIYDLYKDKFEGDLKSRYRKLLRESHPDVNEGTKESIERTKLIYDSKDIIEEYKKKHPTLNDKERIIIELGNLIKLCTNPDRAYIQMGEEIGLSSLSDKVVWVIIRIRSIIYSGGNIKDTIYYKKETEYTRLRVFNDEYEIQDEVKLGGSLSDKALRLKLEIEGREDIDIVIGRGLGKKALNILISLSGGIKIRYKLEIYYDET